MHTGGLWRYAYQATTLFLLHYDMKIEILFFFFFFFVKTIKRLWNTCGAICTTDLIHNRCNTIFTEIVDIISLTIWATHDSVYLVN